MKSVAIGGTGQICSRTVTILRRASHEVATTSLGRSDNVLTSSSSLDAQVVETFELGDRHLAEPPWLEQDALPVDGEAALHLAPECELVQRGLVQG